MPLDIRALISAHAGEASALYEAHVNPRLAKALRLIGFDRNETHRATLDTHDVSVNFLSGDVIEKTGNAQSGQEQTSRKPLARNPRRCLPELPSGWTFDPLAASPP